MVINGPMSLPSISPASPLEQAISIEQSSRGLRENRPLGRRQGGQTKVSLNHINSILDRLRLPTGVNENIIEELVQPLEGCAHAEFPQYRLLIARVLEAALVCTGHYVDTCEFSAAGDLLVNPRQILIHQKGHSMPIVKARHGKLSDQLDVIPEPCLSFPEWFKHNAMLEVTKPALLPDLFQRLEAFGSFRKTYLDSIRQRMDKVADAIGFLSAWQVFTLEDLYTRIQSADIRQRRFIHANLCRFDTADFHRLGLEIERISRCSDCSSRYLAA